MPMDDWPYVVICLLVALAMFMIAEVVMLTSFHRVATCIAITLISKNF